MSIETFVVTFHNGQWQISFDGQWYGAYEDRASAENAAVRIAQSAGELPTRVVVREANGLEETVWEPESVQPEK
jgi:hypothetical protein